MPRDDPSVQLFIARENISRWTEQLAASSDEKQRDTLRQLLQRERQRLDELKREEA